jgi:hypothetical protein
LIAASVLTERSWTAAAVGRSESFAAFATVGLNTEDLTPLLFEFDANASLCRGLAGSFETASFKEKLLDFEYIDDLFD